MEIVVQANKTVQAILKNKNKGIGENRMSCYSVDVPVDEGVLLYNTLTTEMVLLTEAEWENRLENQYLKDHWFTVPQETNEKEFADLVRWVLTTRKKKEEAITGYTIFPTTDCNARCFYCFELGRSRIPMTADTAHKVAQYIKDHCRGEKVKINWFGGEPLFNQEAIDIISQDLRESGVEFVSRAISNGYLFDAATVKKAVESWNMKQVQITLDGTEAVYNKVKAFIYRQGSPYQVVMENIGHLLDASVGVAIRLNMDMHNAENLLELVADLAARFEGRKGLSVYAHHLFDSVKPMADIHSEEEWELRDEAMCRLNDFIRQHGLALKQGVRKTPKMNFCMADSGKAVTILPGGEIGLCEHFSESEFIGHIDQEGFDQAVVNSWKERIPEIPECADCFYYPACSQLKKCSSGSVCFKQLRLEHRRKTEQQMRCEYEMWKNKMPEASEDEVELC